LARFRKPLIIVGVVSLVASAIFSGPAFIKPRFKSTAILYPSNLISYSQESPTEQMIQLLQSADICNQLIRAFDLYHHYEIDSTDNPHQRTDVIKMFDQNVSITKTEYESVDITVYDTDPVVASNMIDSMILFLNLKSRGLQRSKSEEVLNIAKGRMELKKYEMDSIEKLIHQYGELYGLLDFKSQTAEYSRALGRALSSGSKKGTDDARAMLKILAEKGYDFNMWNEHLWRIRGTYNDLKLDYENAVKDVNKELSYETIITHPVASDKKAYPIRWLIVLVSVSVSLFLSFLVLLFTESKQLRK
jgi:hypothetical protein